MEEEKSPMTGMTQEEKDEYVMGKAMDIIMGSGDARQQGYGPHCQG